MGGSVQRLQTSTYKTSFETTLSREQASSTLGGVADKVLGSVKGKKVLIKGGEPKHAFAEYVAYRLGRKLGIGVNEVSLIECGELFGLSRICSVHVWEDKLILANDLTDNFRQKQYPIVRFFDLISNNSDRHSYNYGFVGHDVFLIDHGYSHPWHTNFDSYDLRRQVENNQELLAKYVHRFVSLNKHDWREILRTPKHLQYKFSSEQVDGFLLRMQNIKEFLKPIARNLPVEGKMVANG